MPWWDDLDWRPEYAGEELADLVYADSPFAQAWDDAVEDALEREAAEQRTEALALALAEHRVYDPWPYAEAAPDVRLFKGTGIGALYGISPDYPLERELAGWTLGREPRV